MNWRDLDHPRAGGAERYVESLGGALIDLGHDVTLLASRLGMLQSSSTRGSGLRVVRVGRDWNHRIAVRRWFIQGMEVLAEADVVIESVNTIPYGLAQLVKPEQRCISIVHQLAGRIWEFEYGRLAGTLGPWLEKRLFSAYRNVTVVAVSQSTQRELVGLGVSRVTTVPEGIDSQIFESRTVVPKSPSPSLVFVGRLVKNKRPLDAVAAFCLVKQVYPEARLWIVGRGPLETAIRSLKIDGVVLTGFLPAPEKDRLISSSHLLLVTSVSEGWGLVVTEAASLGTLAVGYDVPGLRDSIPASNGVLCKAEPSELANAILELLRQQELPRPVTGGVLPWKLVAQSVLRAK